MFKKILTITIIILLFSCIAMVSATPEDDLSDYNGFEVKGDMLYYKDINVGFIDEYDDDSFLEMIKAEDPDVIVKAISWGDTEEFDIDTAIEGGAENHVIEFLTLNHMYYSFDKDDKFYLITFDDDGWQEALDSGAVIGDLDDFCLMNSI